MIMLLDNSELMFFRKYDVRCLAIDGRNTWIVKAKSTTMSIEISFVFVLKILLCLRKVHQACVLKVSHIMRMEYTSLNRHSWFTDGALAVHKKSNLFFSHHFILSAMTKLIGNVKILYGFIPDQHRSNLFKAVNLKMVFGCCNVPNGSIHSLIRIPKLYQKSFIEHQYPIA